MRGLSMITAFLLAGCATSAPEGFLEPCILDEDCAALSPELICANVPNQYTGFQTNERLCTLRCQSDSDCPELICEDWVGTDLECVETAATGGTCNTGFIGDVEVRVCGM